jgi:hypothetical protein
MPILAIFSTARLKMLFRVFATFSGDFSGAEDDKIYEVRLTIGDASNAGPVIALVGA